MSRTMKDSGVAWIGELPDSWCAVKLKHCVAIRKRIAGESGRTVLSITQRGIIPKDITSNEGQLASDYSKYQEVCCGDFAMNHMDLLTGWVDISQHEGVTSPDYRVFALTDEKAWSPRYLLHILQTCYRGRVFYGLGQGVSGYGRWRLPADMFLNFPIPCPPQEEQQRIADFLDAQTADIDASIAKTQQSIEKYKKLKQSVITQAVTKGIRPNRQMKDSGVEWIGEIPEEWDCRKVKNVTTKVGSGKTPKGGAEVYADAGVLFIRSQNVYNEGMNYESTVFISPEIDEEMSGSRVATRDVLLNITGGSIGRCCLFTSQEKANVNQHVCIIRCDESECIADFMHYCWVSEIGQMSIALLKNAANREGISGESICNTKITLPSLSEQQEIAAYLDEKCAAIDTLIEKKQQIITKLENYKKSLIYEYVTGKKEVHS